MGAKKSTKSNWLWENKHHIDIILKKKVAQGIYTSGIQLSHFIMHILPCIYVGNIENIKKKTF